ncbi:MAG: preprotein translocase subunit SecE [Pseudomonadales bacterium]|nr:preprotein translocase subunit SecE [Pseudomonadales bacterium]
MSEKTETVSSAAEILKWILVVVLVAVTVVGNYYFGDQPLLYRVVGVLILGLLAIGVFVTTSQGQAFTGLLRESRVEIKKVVWPTRQETLQTTAFVVVIILVMSAALWGFDTLLGFLVSGLLG